MALSVIHRDAATNTSNVIQGKKGRDTILTFYVCGFWENAMLEILYQDEHCVAVNFRVCLSIEAGLTVMKPSDAEPSWSIGSICLSDSSLRPTDIRVLPFALSSESARQREQFEKQASTKILF